MRPYENWFEERQRFGLEPPTPDEFLYERDMTPGMDERLPGKALYPGECGVCHDRFVVDEDRVVPWGDDWAHEDCAA